MLLPLKLICGKRALQNGTNPIYIQYCFQADKRTLLNTEIYLPARYLNKKSGRIAKEIPPQYGHPESLNETLRLQIRIVEDIISFARKAKIENEITFLKKVYRPNLDVSSLEKEADSIEVLERKGDQTKSNLNIYFQIDDYIKSKEKKVCEDMPRIYRNMKEHLLAFEEFRGSPITFDCMDLNFYEELVDFLMYDYVQKRRKDLTVGLKINTIGKTINQLRIFLRNRIRKRIIPPVDMEGWKVLQEEVDAVYLSMSEISRIYNLDLSKHPSLINYRNDFVLGCLTGLRFSDFTDLTREDLRKDMLYKKQNKSDHWVVIPLRDEAKSILTSRFDNNISSASSTEFNKHVKTICKMASIADLIKFSYKKQNKDVVETKPKYQWVTSHTCRRSFCTNEYLAGTPVELIMKISGHKTLKDFYKYIRITPEEAGQKIKELWTNTRGSMKAFEDCEKAAS